MRILHVTPYFAPAWAYGGPPRSVFELSRELVRRGHEVSILTTDALSATERASPSTEVSEGIEVHRCRNLSNYLAWRAQLFLPKGTVSWLRRRISDFDIVHLHMFRTIQNVLAHRYTVRMGIPYVLSPRGSLPRIVRGKTTKALFDLLFGRALLRDAGRLVALSEAEAAQYGAFGVLPARTAVVPNGINAAAYESLPAPGTFKTAHGLDGKRLVTYVGRLNRRKGLEHLLAAFRGLAQDGADLQLVLMGPDEAYEPKLRGTARKWGLTERVTFPGMGGLNDKQAAFVDSEVVAYPAEHEPFGLVPFEALLCGRPVVVSDDSGCGDLVRQAHAGFAVPAGDVTALKRALEALLEDGSRAKDMAIRGRRFVLENLSWTRIAVQMERLYDDAASRSTVPCGAS